MIGNSAYMLNQPDQVIYYQGIFDGGENLEFQFPLQMVGLSFMLANVPYKALHPGPLLFGPALEILSGKGYQFG